MDFLKDYQLIYSNEQYKRIYDYFSNEQIMTVEELFLLTTVIGFNYPDKKREIKEGPTMSGKALSNETRMRLYTMILADRELGKDITSFKEKDFQEHAVKRIEVYAAIGIQKLVQEVLIETWNGQKLNESYSDYKTDILSYIYEIAKEPIF